MHSAHIEQEIFLFRLVIWYGTDTIVVHLNENEIADDFVSEQNNKIHL